MTLINLKNIDFLPERHSCDWIFKVENFLSEEFYNDIQKELNSTSRSPYLETYNSFKKGIQNSDKNFIVFLENKKKTFSLFQEINKVYFKKFFLSKLFYKILKYKLEYKAYFLRFLFKYFFNTTVTTMQISFIKNKGYLKPHVDSNNKILSLMLYFPRYTKNTKNILDTKLETKEKKIGTTFYNLNKSNFNNNEIDRSDFLKLNPKEIITTDFKENTLYGFIKHSKSWHAVEEFNIADDYERLSININFKII
jgi:hypothetical protein